MSQLKVTCINKPDRNSTHEHISHIGGVTNGSRWKKSRELVIDEIDRRVNSFYVVDPRSGKISYVAVVRPLVGNPYLRTHADGDWNNNLLSLEECSLW